MSSCTGPQSPGGQAGELQYWAQSDHLTSLHHGRAWLVLVSSDPLDRSQPTEPAVLYSHFLVADRRLAAEEGSLSKKTWSRKILVGG